MGRNAGRRVNKRDWVCEPALWVRGWQNKGDLAAISNCSLLCLETTSFANVIKCFPCVHFDVALYAHWALQQLFQCRPEDMSDLWMIDLNVQDDSRHGVAGGASTDSDCTSPRSP